MSIPIVPEGQPENRPGREPGVNRIKRAKPRQGRQNIFATNFRDTTRAAALVAMAAVAGCASPPDRSAILDELNPAPMSSRAWSHAVGTYIGPIHASTQRGGFDALAAMETRLDLSGWSDSPEVLFQMDKGYSTSWTEYGEWRGTFTNIPYRRYGAQGEVTATTHAPNQMLLVLRRNRTASREGVWLILTFHENGSADVDWVGRSGWRGQGELSRATLPNP